MNIAFDGDGVLTDLETYQIEHGKKYFKNIPEEQIDRTEIDIKEIFNCTSEEREKFWIKYIWKYCLSEKPRENIAATIRKLKSEGDKIYIITGRAHTTEQNVTGALFRKMMIYWLDKNNIPYEDIVFCSEKNSAEDKVKACLKYNIDVIIDDKKENIEELNKITKVICFDAEYNRCYNHPNVPRVKNSNEIYNEIQKFKNPNYFKKSSLEIINNMTNEEKIQYFNNLREYYKNLPYDEIKYNSGEKNYSIVSKIGVPIYNLLYKPTVFNRELVPSENGLLFVANHNNYYDQFPIISAIGDNRPIHFLTATKMLNMKRGAIYLKTGAVSIDREDANDREFAKDEVIKIISNNSNAFIFPEGRTNRNEGFLLDFHPGAAAIAQITGCKIVPIAVSANYDRKAGEPYVRFGEPLTVSSTENVIDATERIKEIIGELKQENERCIEANKVYKK